MRRFEFVEGTSNKFWEISVEGDSVTVRFGKVGTNGQSQTKTFASESEAKAQHDKQIAEKLKKGYVEVGAVAATTHSATDLAADQSIRKETEPGQKKTRSQSTLPKESNLPKTVYESPDDPEFLKQFKSSLAKRFSLVSHQPLLDAVKLALFLLALGRDDEALEFLTPVASDAKLTRQNYNIWDPLGAAIAVQTYILNLKGEHAAAERTIATFRENSGFNFMGMLGLLKVGVEKIEADYNKDSTKAACDDLAYRLTWLIKIRESFRYKIGVPDGFLLDVDAFENLISLSFKRLKQRLHGEKPAETSPERIAKQVEKAEKEVNAAREKAREIDLNLANDQASRGDPESAMQSLEVLAAQKDNENSKTLGTSIAKASELLARFYAYQGRWRDVLGVIEALVMQPKLWYIGHYEFLLAARAAKVTGDQSRLARIVEKQRTKLMGQRLPIPPLVQALDDYAAGRVTEPVKEHLSEIFSKTKLPAAGARDEYAAYMNNLPQHMPPYARKDPQFILSYSFTYAIRFGQFEEAFRLFKNNKSLRTWSRAEELARCMVARQDNDGAWALIKEALPDAPIAPIELVVREDYIELMTPERLLEVLSTPRLPDTVTPTQVDKQPGPKRAAKKLTVRLFPSAEPIKEAITKFGGQPVWLKEAQWPLSASTGKLMSFIAQVRLEPSVFGKIQGQMAYLFMTDDEDGGLTSDPEAGENAVIIQPDGQLPTYVEPLQAGQFDPNKIELNVKPLKVKAINEGPTYCADVRAELTPGEDNTSSLKVEDEDDEEGDELDGIDELKIGGIPVFLQNEEYPKGGSSQWKLLLQMGDEALPSASLNFGMGYCYAFISKDGRSGKFLWQCD